MKRFLLVSGAILMFCALIFQSVPQSVAADTPQVSVDGDKPLCLPTFGAGSPADCLPLGPYQQVSDMAKVGITFPARPLPGVKPDYSLTTNPVLIAKINLPKDEPAPIYATFDDATQGQNPTRFIDPGALRYVSYVGVEYYKDKPYVRLKSGEWMRASLIAYSYFQGLEFSQTPPNSFGWIVDTAEVRNAPGYQAGLTSTTLYPQTLVQIYDVQSQGGTDWYMVGMNQWVERRYIRQVRIDTNPPDGVTGDRWIDVNLYDQTLAVYDHDQLVFATLLTSGEEPFYTRPGVFQIYEKKETETMTGAFEADRSDYYYLEDVPWTMYFDEARALHGAYWRTTFGYPGSHGCVNLSIGDAKWLFDWANVGDYVHVWDPSGQTPTDPGYYGAGGA
jgi:hypothetical protein